MLPAVPVIACAVRSPPRTIRGIHGLTAEKVSDIVPVGAFIESKPPGLKPVKVPEPRAIVCELVTFATAPVGVPMNCPAKPVSVPKLTSAPEVLAIHKLCDPAPPLAVIVPVVTPTPEVSPLDRNTGPPKKTPEALVLILPRLSAPWATITTALPCPNVVALVLMLPVVIPPFVPILMRYTLPPLLTPEALILPLMRRVPDWAAARLVPDVPATTWKVAQHPVLEM